MEHSGVAKRREAQGLLPPTIYWIDHVIAINIIENAL